MLEVKRKLEESQRQAELEKFQQENERILKKRQQTKEKVSFLFNDKLNTFDRSRIKRFYSVKDKK